MSLRDQWEKTSTYLRAAKSVVILGEHDEAEFESWMEHNELDLAWDSLYDNHKVEAAKERQFLLRMLQAATLMGLDPKVNKVFERLK